MKKIIITINLLIFFVLGTSLASGQEFLNEKNIYNTDSLETIEEETPKEKVKLYLFYGRECPHCKKEEAFLDKLEKEKDNLEIERYEVWHDRGNAELLSRIAKELNLTVSGVPILFVGNETIVGFGSEQTTGKEILSVINYHEEYGCTDIVGPIIRGEKVDSTDCSNDCSGGDECMHDCAETGECVDNCGCYTQEKKDNIPDAINVPLIGEINTKNFSLPIFTIIIAGIDGFNPCAMWVLIFLISLLLNMEDRKRMWILGFVFILSSGAVYFLFLSAWLNLFLFLGFIFLVRLLIGLVALSSGGYHIYDYWKNRDGGCKVTSGEKRKRIFDKLKEIVSEKHFYLALLGIILLAFAVNLVELVCSAGLPAVYTQVLALSGLPSWQYYFYLVFYIIIFMLDDIIIFTIAMITLKTKAISSRYTRWTGLLGGIIMIIIGLLLLFKPGWLMFG